MTEWISVKDRLPKNNICALVLNTKGWMIGGFTRALYHPREDAWQLYDPHYRESILLEVTHWMPLPEPPRE